MSKLFQEVVNIYQKGGEGVLVTLCSTKGSTPRKAGAKMLVYPDGSTCGTIGGGELELDAIKRALEVIKTKKSVLLENALQDLGMVCGGAGTLYLEYLCGKN